MKFLIPQFYKQIIPVLAKPKGTKEFNFVKEEFFLNPVHYYKEIAMKELEIHLSNRRISL